MGLAVRVIPTLLKKGENLVKGERFNAWRTVGHIEQAARICGARAVDEIILLDIGATPSGTGPDFACIERIASNFFTPLTVGGGVRSVEDVQRLLASGADKVAIQTALFEVNGLLPAIAGRWGNQVVVAGMDIKAGLCAFRCGEYTLAADNPLNLAHCLQEAGAGEILLTSVDREGTMQGYDLELIRAVSQAVDIPVIAHGGCSGYEDMVAAVNAGASAVAAGALFQFTDATPLEAARYLQKAGIEARVPA